MRQFIDLVTNMLVESNVVPFPGNNRPVNKLAKAQGGADLYRAVRNPDLHTLDAFTQGYVKCALWTDEEQLEEQGAREVDWANVHHESAERMIASCAKFQSKFAELLDRAYEAGWSEEQAGHDFWLTRNGHGTGFWDRGYDDDGLGEELSKAARSFGECSLYAGDDGTIHLD